MFTGIIQGLGEITALNRLGQDSRLAIRPLFVMPDIVPGESIAVNGVCLSVEKSSDGQFCAYASGETLSRSNLCFFGWLWLLRLRFGRLRSPVNMRLEMMKRYSGGLMVYDSGLPTLPLLICA